MNYGAIRFTYYYHNMHDGLNRAVADTKKTAEERRFWTNDNLNRPPQPREHKH